MSECLTWTLCCKFAMTQVHKYEQFITSLWLNYFLGHKDDLCCFPKSKIKNFFSISWYLNLTCQSFHISGRFLISNLKLQKFSSLSLFKFSVMSRFSAKNWPITAPEIHTKILSNTGAAYLRSLYSYGETATLIFKKIFEACFCQKDKVAHDASL